jgi:uncharacterized protein
MGVMPLMPPPIPKLEPVKERVWTIDVIRGVALLGILLLNIQSFSMPIAAYSNPEVFGIETRLDLWVSRVVHVVGSFKFMSMFSILFGVGIVLMSRHIEPLGRSTSRHYVRMAWLLAFGMIHAYVFWHGDILVGYAMAGMVVYWLRNLSARTLLRIGIGGYLVGAVIVTGLGSLNMIAGDMGPGWEWLSNEPSYQSLQTEIAAMQGSWLDQMRYRGLMSIFMQLNGPFFFIPINGSLMVLGMALLKSGWIGEQRSSRSLGGLALLCIPVGWTLSAFELWIGEVTHASADVRVHLLSAINLIAAPITAIGYIALVQVICATVGRRLTLPLERVGRMALSCYLGTTLICTTIFYGHGFGYFGTMSRSEQQLVTLGVWVILILFATTWLQFFEQGPMEWLWRRLVYRGAKRPTTSA